MKKKKLLFIVLFLLYVVSLTGCNSTELEARKFPLAVAIDKVEQNYIVTLGFQNLSEIADQKAKDVTDSEEETGSDSWYSAFEHCNTENPKTMDYNHVKAIIISKDVLEDEATLEEFLSYIEQQETFSRNTLLFISDEAAGNIVLSSTELELPIGTYLAEMTGGNAEMSDRAVVTIGSLLNEWHNQNENLFIPIVSMVEEKPTVEKYYILKSFVPSEEADSDIVRMAYLLDNKMNQYQFELDSGETIKLTNIKCSYEYQTEKEKMKIIISVKAEAKVLNRNALEETEQKQIKLKMDSYLKKEFETEAKNLQTEQKVDICNSFYRLGGYNREAYYQYINKKDLYEKSIVYDICFDITPVN